MCQLDMDEKEKKKVNVVRGLENVRNTNDILTYSENVLY